MMRSSACAGPASCLARSMRCSLCLVSLCTACADATAGCWVARGPCAAAQQRSTHAGTAMCMVHGGGCCCRRRGRCHGHTLLRRRPSYIVSSVAQRHRRRRRTRKPRVLGISVTHALRLRKASHHAQDHSTGTGPAADDRVSFGVRVWCRFWQYAARWQRPRRCRFSPPLSPVGIWFGLWRSARTCPSSAANVLSFIHKCCWCWCGGTPTTQNAAGHLCTSGKLPFDGMLSCFQSILGRLWHKYHSCLRCGF